MSEAIEMKMHFFFYNIHEMPQEQRFSSAEFNDGIEAVLKKKRYKELAGMPSHIKLYISEICVDPYLAIVEVEGYHFFWHIRDADSLHVWQAQYMHRLPSHFVTNCLPPPAAEPKITTFQMNKQALRSRL